MELLSRRHKLVGLTRTCLCSRSFLTLPVEAAILFRHYAPAQISFVRAGACLYRIILPRFFPALELVSPSPPPSARWACCPFSAHWHQAWLRASQPASAPRPCLSPKAPSRFWAWA